MRGETIRVTMGAQVKQLITIAVDRPSIQFGTANRATMGSLFWQCGSPHKPAMINGWEKIQEIATAEKDCRDWRNRTLTIIICVPKAIGKSFRQHLRIAEKLQLPIVCIPVKRSRFASLTQKEHPLTRKA